MKTLSIIQPWASLIFAPAPFGKQYETRHWYTTYRGPLAIHASSRVSFIRESGDLSCRTEPFKTALARMGFTDNEALPFGALLGVVDLVDCIGTDSTRADALLRQAGPAERSFGDFSEGRFMWRLANPRRFPEPIPARGALNLWDCTLPEEIKL